MYLVTKIQENSLQHASLFKNFEQAADFADDLIVDFVGVTDRLPHWQSGEYYHQNGINVTLIPIQIT